MLRPMRGGRWKTGATVPIDAGDDFIGGEAAHINGIREHLENLLESQIEDGNPEAEHGVGNPRHAEYLSDGTDEIINAKRKLEHLRDGKVVLVTHRALRGRSMPDNLKRIPWIADLWSGMTCAEVCVGERVVPVYEDDHEPGPNERTNVAAYSRDNNLPIII